MTFEELTAIFAEWKKRDTESPVEVMYCDEDWATACANWFLYLQRELAR